MKKIIITGSSGMLGSDIVQYFHSQNKYQIFGFDIVSSNKKFYKERIFDITDLVKLKQFISEIKPDIIIHAAAIVNLELCEKNPI